MHKRLSKFKQDEVFGLSNGHCFPARAVAVTGRWNRGKWVGGAGKDELERKYGLWVHNLSRCVECAGEECDGTADDAGTGAGTDAGTAVEYHRVQPSWFLNSFIFGTRPWSAAPPRSLSYVAANNAHAAEGAPAGAPVGASPLTHTPNTSNKSGLSAARRAQVIEDWNASRRAEKHTRRMGRKTPEQRMVAEALLAAVGRLAQREVLAEQRQQHGHEARRVVLGVGARRWAET